MSRRKKPNSGNPAAAAADAVLTVITTAVEAAMAPTAADGDKALSDALNRFEAGARGDAFQRRYTLAMGLCKFAMRFGGPDQDWRPAMTGPDGQPTPANETTVGAGPIMQGQLAGGRMVTAALNHDLDTTRAIWLTIVDANDPHRQPREMAATWTIVKTLAALIIEDAHKGGQLTPADEELWQTRRPWPART